MTQQYWESKRADYTLRIANLDALRRESMKQGNLLHAKACEKKMHELEAELAKLEEDAQHDGQGKDC